MTMTVIGKALKAAAEWVDWERETINDFHLFAQRFGSTPGSNVYDFVLRDALRFRGLTIEQLRDKK